MCVAQGVCLGQQDVWSPLKVFLASAVINAGVQGGGPLLLQVVPPGRQVEPPPGRAGGGAAAGGGRPAPPANSTPASTGLLRCCAVGDIWLVMGPLQMGLAGAAMATAAAQYACAAFFLWYLWKKGQRPGGVRLVWTVRRQLPSEAVAGQDACGSGARAGRRPPTEPARAPLPRRAYRGPARWPSLGG